MISLKPLAGALALAFLAVLAGGACLSLAVEALRGSTEGFAAFDGYLWRIARFTLLQALLSMLLSVGLAIPLARALHAHPDFPGRTMILRLFALPLALPALVAVLGITSIYGRNGLLAALFSWLGLDVIPNIYGLTGILIAHVFFNLPLATRLLLSSMDSIPEDYWKLSSQLGMGKWARFRLIEWPVILRNISGIAGLIFMLCITSFTIVLTLGGGPRATTLEVAIYQSLHFDFDIARAVSLTLVQLCLTIAVLSVLSPSGRPTEEGFSLRTTTRRFDQPTLRTRLLDGATIILGLLFVALPIVGTVVSGLAADLLRLLGESLVWRAILTSIVLGASAAALSLVISLALVVAREYLASRRGYASPKLFERSLDRGASLIMVIPPIVIGSGWFISLTPFCRSVQSRTLYGRERQRGDGHPFCISHTAPDMGYGGQPPQPAVRAIGHYRMEPASTYRLAGSEAAVKRRFRLCDGSVARRPWNDRPLRQQFHSDPALFAAATHGELSYTGCGRPGIDPRCAVFAPDDRS